MAPMPTALHVRLSLSPSLSQLGFIPCKSPFSSLFLSVFCLVICSRAFDIHDLELEIKLVMKLKFLTGQVTQSSNLERKNPRNKAGAVGAGIELTPRLAVEVEVMARVRMVERRRRRARDRRGRSGRVGLWRGSGRGENGLTYLQRWWWWWWWWWELEG